MSLASSPDCQIRAEDKAFNMLFFPTVEDPLGNNNSFDDFVNVNCDLSNGDDNDNNNNKEPFNSFLDSFEREAIVNGTVCLSPITAAKARTSDDGSSPEPWRKGLWCLNEPTTSSSSEPMIVQERSKPAAASNACGDTGDRGKQLVCVAPAKYFTNFSRLLTSQPSPYTPCSHKGTGKPNLSPRKVVKPDRSPRNTAQTFSREVTLSPTPMYAKLPLSGGGSGSGSGMDSQETWQQDFQSFNLHQVGEDAGYHSPHQLGGGRGGGGLTGIGGRGLDIINMATVSQDDIVRQHPGLLNNAGDGGTLSSPAISSSEHYSSLNPTGHADSTSYASNGLDVDVVVVHRPPQNQQPSPRLEQLDDSQEAHPIPVWTAEHLDSPIGSGCCCNNNAQGPSSSSTGGQSQPQSWWPGPTQVPPKPHSVHPSQDQIYPTLVAPTPHRPTHQLLQAQSFDRHLGIQYSGLDVAPGEDLHQPLSPLEPVYSYPPPLPSLGQNPPFAHKAQAAPAGHGGNHHVFSNNLSAFTTHRRRKPYTLTYNNNQTTFPHLSPPRLRSRSPSPSVPPGATSNHNSNYASTSRSLQSGGGSNAISPTRTSHTRRKSIGAPKASSATHTHHHHHSSPSASHKSQRTPRTPKTPSSFKTPVAGPFSSSAAAGTAPPQLDFVNFTPADSAKLLSVVAPSGSSKTRARCEQEARDRRRKLSEAAVRAVRKAGGDVGEIERAVMA